VHTADKNTAATTAAPAAKAATRTAVQPGQFTPRAPKLVTEARKAVPASRKRRTLV
jgi:hypothetical protein